jgi:hypothetical protein
MIRVEFIYTEYIMMSDLSGSESGSGRGGRGSGGSGSNGDVITPMPSIDTVYGSLGIQEDGDRLVMPDLPDQEIDERFHKVATRLMNLTLAELPLAYLQGTKCEEGVGGRLSALSKPLVACLAAQPTNTALDLKTMRRKVILANRQMVSLAVAYELTLSPCKKVSEPTKLLQTMVESSSMDVDIDFGIDLDKLDMTKTVLSSKQFANKPMYQGILIGLKILNFLAVAFVLYMFAKLILS